MCKFSSPLPLAQGQLHKMGLIGIMGALAAWLLLKDECLIYVSVILTPAWLNWLAQAIVCQGLFFQRSSYRWCFYVTDTKLWALTQYVALMVCCSTSFLSEITKSTDKFIGFSSHLSGLFLWYQNVNRCDCSRIQRIDVELLLDNRQEHLFGKYPPSRDVNIQSASPPLSNPLLWIKRCPLAGPQPNCGLELAEMGPCSHFPALFLLGCLRIGFCVRWETRSPVCSSWAKLLLFEGMGMMGSFFSTGIKWRLSTNLNPFDGFSLFD